MFVDESTYMAVVHNSPSVLLSVCRVARQHDGYVANRRYKAAHIHVMCHAGSVETGHAKKYKLSQCPHWCWHDLYWHSTNIENRTTTCKQWFRGLRDKWSNYRLICHIVVVVSETHSMCDRLQRQYCIMFAHKRQSRIVSFKHELIPWLQHRMLRRAADYVWYSPEATAKRPLPPCIWILRSRLN